MTELLRFTSSTSRAVKIWIIYLIAYCVEGVLSGTCYRDQSLGERDGNVYSCNSKDLPRCCTLENGQFSCCIAESSKNWTEQLQLWGAVGGFLVLIVLVFLFCKNDISCCNSDLTLKERWHQFRHKGKNREAHLIEKDEQIKGAYYDNPIGRDYDSPRDRYPVMRDPYHFPPLPSQQQTLNYDHLSTSYA